LTVAADAVVIVIVLFSFGRTVLIIKQISQLCKSFLENLKKVLEGGAMKYHISDDGEARRCEASEGNCRFADASEHFSSKSAARKFYESSMKSKEIRSFSKKNGNPNRWRELVQSYPERSYGWTRHGFESEEQKQELHKRNLKDFEENLHWTEHEDGSVTCSVYRVGQCESFKKGDQTDYYDAIDACRPKRTPPRNGSLYAAPTLSSTARWVESNGSRAVNEITVDPNKVKVFYIPAFEKSYASSESSVNRRGVTTPQDRELMENYWSTGLTLSEFVKNVREDPEFIPQDWEILLSKNDVHEVSEVSERRKKKWVKREPGDFKLAGY
jgi:hypothetical protein